MLCRKYGATAAYTPMLHARLFSEGAKYREEHLTTCPKDRPLFVQFCANDPDVLVNAAQHVEEAADYIDLNFGCPQRIAKKGRYGAFLMDDLPCVASLVRALHEVRLRAQCRSLMFGMFLCCEHCCIQARHVLRMSQLPETGCLT